MPHGCAWAPYLKTLFFINRNLRCVRRRPSPIKRAIKRIISPKGTQGLESRGGCALRLRSEQLSDAHGPTNYFNKGVVEYAGPFYLSGEFELRGVTWPSSITPPRRARAKRRRARAAQGRTSQWRGRRSTRALSRVRVRIRVDLTRARGRRGLG